MVDFEEVGLASFGIRDAASLGDILSDSNLMVRHCAAELLCQLGPNARPALPCVVEMLKDDDCFFRTKAAEIISRMGPLAQDAIPALIEALADMSDNVRRWAVFALGEIGPAASIAIPDLEQFRDNADMKSRAVATVALRKILDESAF